MLQVTFQVDAKELGPTLRDIVDAMTVEQRQKLAGDIAYKYFEANMKTVVYRDAWGRDQTGADAFLRELVTQTKQHITTLFLNDPELKGKIEGVLELIRPELPTFIQNALISIIGDRIGSLFNGMMSIEGRQFRAEEALRKLGQPL